MIELIFALVIMGIVLMSAPMLVAQATKSSLVLLQQEAIAGGASQIEMILTKHWDEADTNQSLTPPILLTNSTVSMFQSLYDNNISIGRAGTPKESSRTFNTSIGELNATLDLSAEDPDDNGTKDDIDDYHNWVTTITPLSVGNDDYKDALTLTTTISYISDSVTRGTSSLTFNDPFSASAPTGTTNIKQISIEIKSNSDVGTDIRLNAFSCNIGTYTLQRRSF